MDGAFVVDKPAGWTSHDVVNKMRRIARTRRVGHLGTLDPMATGVLPLVVERATRLSQYYVKSDKVYDAVIRFGRATDTFDAEGTPAGEDQPYTTDVATVDRMLDSFRGTILQMPPRISAKKIDGQPAYKLARKNLEVKLNPVQVTVHSADVLECEANKVRVKVHCSAGTYLRVIAHELGQAAGCGAYLERLVRLRSGDFTIEQAHTLERLAELAAAERLEEALIPAGQLLPGFPSEVVDMVTEGQIRNGRDFRASPFRVTRNSPYVKALGHDGALVCIGELKLPNLYHPITVL
ncbi:MAG: tRNA pseudouridine(55) synthase TruB [Acidobacteria bacterium]|nr:tRNA pseudouridine(55) synthase TruB [Acidobacteriota bacterium]